MAVIRPYTLRPVAPQMALLLGSGEAVAEDGSLHSLDALPKGIRVFASWDRIDALLVDGVGEAFCWDGEPIRWRHRRFDDGPVGWTRRHLDVTVLRLPFPLIIAGAAVLGVVARRWRPRWFPVEATAAELAGDGYLVDQLMLRGELAHTKPSRTRASRAR